MAASLEAHISALRRVEQEEQEWGQEQEQAQEKQGADMCTPRGPLAEEAETSDSPRVFPAPAPEPQHDIVPPAPEPEAAPERELVLWVAERGLDLGAVRRTCRAASAKFADAEFPASSASLGRLVKHEKVSGWARASDLQGFGHPTVFGRHGLEI